MARIRTIKPDFWRDDKISSLKNKLAGYFFIALWNISDDEGKFKMNPHALHLECPIFRTREIVTYLSELSQKGLIMESECSHWGLITNWFHQKIDKPKVPKVKKEQIQWLPLGHSTTSRDHSTTSRRMYSIGKDSIGKDSISSQGGAEAPPPGPKKLTPNPLNNQTWEAYASSYYERYKTEPVRNATVNAQIAQIVKRLGSESPDVVAHFVRQDGFYASRNHAIGLCLKDAEALRTQWATGTRAPNALMSKNDQLAETVRRQREMIDSGEI